MNTNLYYVKSTVTQLFFLFDSESLKLVGTVFKVIDVDGRVRPTWGYALGEGAGSTENWKCGRSSDALQKALNRYRKASQGQRTQWAQASEAVMKIFDAEAAHQTLVDWLKTQQKAEDK